jgi:hypothetical protein
MALTPDTEASGLKAYEQARAFERLKSWRLPLSYGVFVLVPVLSGGGMALLGHPVPAFCSFLAAALFGWISSSHWKELRARYARNSRLLAQLKAEYGEELPWIQVENHFAALEKLKREMAESGEGKL